MPPSSKISQQTLPECRRLHSIQYDWKCFYPDLYQSFIDANLRRAACSHKWYNHEQLRRQRRKRRQRTETVNQAGLKTVCLTKNQVWTR